jgi:hypothetical protein
MALHLIKLCVGVSEISELRQWVRDARKGLETLDHTTRMFPTRGDEILNGGSLYWVIRGMILCRQPIAGLVQVRGKDGISRCRIDFKAKIVLVGSRRQHADDAAARENGGPPLQAVSNSRPPPVMRSRRA